AGAATLLTLPMAAAAQAPPRTAEPGASRKQTKDDRTQPVTVDADKMERFGKEGLVVFTGTVVARQNNSVQYADRMEVYLDESGDRIVRTVANGADMRELKGRSRRGGHAEVVQDPQGRRQRLARYPARRGGRTTRAERCRQDDILLHDDGSAADRGRPHFSRGPGDHRATNVP